MARPERTNQVARLSTAVFTDQMEAFVHEVGEQAGVDRFEEEVCTKCRSVLQFLFLYILPTMQPTSLTALLHICDLLNPRCELAISDP